MSLLILFMFVFEFAAMAIELLWWFARVQPWIKFDMFLYPLTLSGCVFNIVLVFCHLGICVRVFRSCVLKMPKKVISIGLD